MAAVKIDWECCAEQWWDAAHELAKSAKDPTFTRIYNRLFEGSGDVVGDEVLRGELDSFVAAASALPGWEDGPRYARNPLLFSFDDEVQS